MKLINIICMIVLSFVFMLSCKSNQSGLDQFVTINDKEYYLFGIAFGGKKSEEVICRFKCDDLPVKIEDRQSCHDPHYIKRSSVSKSSILNEVYEDINDTTVTKARKITKNVQDELDFNFFDTKTNETLGEAKLICKDVLGSEKNTNIAMYYYNQATNPENESALSKKEIDERIKQINSMEKEQSNSVEKKDWPITGGKFHYYEDSITSKIWAVLDNKMEPYVKINETRWEINPKLEKSCSELLNGGWRLPTIVELYTLYKHGGGKIIVRTTKGTSLEEELSKIISDNIVVEKNSNPLDASEYLWSFDLRSGNYEKYGLNDALPVLCVRIKFNR